MNSINKIFAIIFLFFFCFANNIKAQEGNGDNDPDSYKEAIQTEYFSVKTNTLQTTNDLNDLIKSKLKEYKAYTINLEELVKYAEETPFRVAFDFKADELNINIDLVRNELRSKNYISNLVPWTLSRFFQSPFSVVSLS